MIFEQQTWGLTAGSKRCGNATFEFSALKTLDYRVGKRHRVTMSTQVGCDSVSGHYRRADCLAGPLIHTQVCQHLRGAEYQRTGIGYM